MKLSDFLNIAAATNPEQWMAFLKAESAPALTTESTEDGRTAGTEEEKGKKRKLPVRQRGSRR